MSVFRSLFVVSTALALHPGCPSTPEEVAADSHVGSDVHGDADGGSSPDATTVDAPSPQDADSDAPPIDAGGGDGSPGVCEQPPSSDPTAVQLQQGTLTGLAASDGLRTYLGIPFAQPPVGDLRWTPPQPPSCFEGVYPASQWSSKCAQTGDGSLVGDEDCLYLNVWTPSPPAADQPRAVMVFVHGGGNMTGSASDEVQDLRLYDGEELARRGDVVVVTLQYRLNVFGYAVADALDADSATGTSGNYGLRDQVAALRWVQANIGAFGGDPERVLLFGESGGASDVCAHVSSPLSAGLFHRAIIQSGGCTGRNRDDVRGWTASVLSNTSCDNSADSATYLACLRTLTAADLAQALADLSDSVTGGLPTPRVGPTVGDDVVPGRPVDRFGAGEHHPVPVVIGSNADETATLLFGIPYDMTVTHYQQAVQLTFGAAASDVLDVYPVEAFATPRDAWVAVTTDVSFTCPTRATAAALVEGGTSPVYRYFYTHVIDASPFIATFGAGHGMELYYVFQTLGDVNFAPTAADSDLEASFLHYWTALAQHGDPNDSEVAGLPTWASYTSGADRYLELTSPVVAGDGVRTDRCDFWATLVW